MVSLKCVETKKYSFYIMEKQLKIQIIRFLNLIFLKLILIFQIFSTQTVTQQKIQETSTRELVICSLMLNKIKKDINNTLSNNQ